MTHHLIPPSRVHEAVLVTQDLQPQLRHRVHPLTLRQLREVLQEDLAQQRRRAKPRLAHAVRIAPEDLRLEKLLEEGEEDPLKDDRQIDVGVLEDLGREEGSLEAADGILTELAGRVEAELGVGGEEGDPSGFPCYVSNGLSARSTGAREGEGNEPREGGSVEVEISPGIDVCTSRRTSTICCPRTIATSSLRRSTKVS